ncbi:NRAMP family divalent metal transporter [Leadbetterella byssophila]|uniref:NRAMP family divalent metal transporter n=1 Tax=Leadbetterella byssophila TaxID=316068 RepID=UPI0039A326ED
MKRFSSPFIAATFMMATSAIGPGFLTQTTVFTQQLLYNFGFVILLSLVIDIIAQVSIWQALSYSNSSVQKLAHRIHPVLSWVFCVAIATGGLVFNIGNLAGAGLGLNALLALPTPIGVILSALIAIILFLSKSQLKWLDYTVKILGVLMILMLMGMVFMTQNDFGKILKFTFLPEEINIKATLTLVGGTVGGYITFAGAQRLLDSGIVGPQYQSQVKQSAYRGILLTGTFRFLLYWVILYIVIQGGHLNPDNPTASVFESYFGSWGNKAFGLMIFSAALTSVIGATYTSISFLKDLNQAFTSKWTPALFVIPSLLIYLWLGKPVVLLVWAGYMNSFILPVGLAIVLFAIQKWKILPLSKVWLFLAWLTVMILLGFGIYSFL